MKTNVFKRIPALIIAGITASCALHAQTYGAGAINTLLSVGTMGGNTTTMIGAAAGQNNSATGLYNTFLGYQAGNTNSTGDANTFTGYQSGFSNTTSNNSFYGWVSGYNTTTGADNTYLGTYAGFGNVTGSANICIGYGAGYTSGSADHNVFIGMNSGYSNTTGASNAYTGYGTCMYNSTGSSNTVMGYQAGFGVAGNSHSNNSFFGSMSGYAITTGTENAFFGTNSGVANTSGIDNTFMGLEAGRSNNTGRDNTCLGHTSGTGTTTGNNNLFAGATAGNTNVTGTNNTCVGSTSDVQTNALTNASAFGYGTIVCASNEIVFGNGSVTRWGFGVCPASGHAIEVGTSASNGNGAYLTSGGAWTNGSSRAFKDNITPLNGEDVLDKICKLEVARWRYTGTEEYHIGPFAEDFYKSFQTGTDNQHISTIDPAGVALVGIQQLNKHIVAQQQQIDQQNEALKAKDEEISAIRNDVSTLKAQLAQLDNALAQCCMSYQGTAGTNNAAADVPSLQQNTPNPFSESTVIRYYIPQNAKTAAIKIIAANGVELKSFPIAQKGNGELNVPGNSFEAGTYVYALFIDGVKVDSKVMVLSK